jgi:hypothetical protein
MKTPEQKEIDKLFRAYDKAEAALIKKRDELFPVGCMVKDRRYPELSDKIIRGSLYPHQIMTMNGHISWRCLERV